MRLLFTVLLPVSNEKRIEEGYEVIRTINVVSHSSSGTLCFLPTKEAKET